MRQKNSPAGITIVVVSHLQGIAKMKLRHSLINIICFFISRSLPVDRDGCVKLVKVLWVQKITIAAYTWAAIKLPVSL